MRKLNNPMPSGGAPFTNEDLNDVFQGEIWAAMQAMLSQYDSDSEGVIVSGCAVTPNASNFDMTAGIVYLNGEFMRVEAVTNQTFTKYIKASAAVNVARTFNDAASKTFIIEKKAEVSATADGGGQEITISSLYSSLYRRIEFLNGSHAVNVTSAGSESVKRILKKTIEIGDWNMDSDSSVGVATGITDSELKIRGIFAMIRDDAGNQYPLHSKINITGAAGGQDGWIYGVGSTDTIGLVRLTGGFFDGTNYDSTSYNRGWVTIFYEE